MKRTRCIIVTLCVLSIIISSLNGCQSSDQNSRIFLYDAKEEQEKIIVTAFGYKADTLNLLAIEDALHGFMDENQGITVTYEGIKGSAYWDALSKRAAEGVMDDIIMVNHDTVLRYGNQGLLADLSGLPGLDNFTELAVEQFLNEDGTVWFLPICISTYALYINLDLLNANGQTVPENWSEFSELCDYYVEKGIVPIIANNYRSIDSLITAKSMYDVYQTHNSAETIEAINQGEIDLAEKLTVGIEMAREMIDRGWFDCTEVLATEQTSDDLELFAQGERPFMITGGWASPRVAELEPQFEYKIYPYPIMDDGSVLLIDVNTCVSVNANSEYVDEALDFLAYLVEPDVMWNYCDSQSSHTALIDDRTPSDQTIAPASEYIENGPCVIGSDYRLTLNYDAALTECAHALLNGASAEEAEMTLRNALYEGGV